ncbi:MAG: type II secretion system F family protein [Anaerolineaceae bacterium]|nr:type II secretion system F family protein [Anaerolineaceae bacterium]
MTTTIIFIVVGLLIVGGAAALVYIGMRQPQTNDDRALLERLDEFNQRGEQVDLEKIELSLPFQERIIFPMARKLGDIAVKFTPQNAMRSISRNLELAGNPGRMDPTIFLALQFIIAVVLLIVLIVVFTVGQSDWPVGQKILMAGGGAVIGFYLPQLWLTSKIQARQKEIRKAMPDALDLLTICVEAGLGFDAALAKVSEKWESELSLAFSRVIQEVQLGKIRREALRDMSDRIGLAEMTSFVAAVIQSEQLGVSMAKVLRIQSDQMRVKRRQLAEEEAHKAPIKMLLPMAGLIFPALFISLMAPAALRLMNSAMAGMF